MKDEEDTECVNDLPLAWPMEVINLGACISLVTKTRRDRDGTGSIGENCEKLKG